jgi:hypothetical protein
MALPVPGQSLLTADGSSRPWTTILQPLPHPTHPRHPPPRQALDITQVPRGLETPRYRVLRAARDYEIRSYPAFLVADAPMGQSAGAAGGARALRLRSARQRQRPLAAAPPPAAPPHPAEPLPLDPPATRQTRGPASGAGFNELARYIFGGNAAKESLEMTTPVLTEPTEAGPVMSFVMEERFPGAPPWNWGRGGGVQLGSARARCSTRLPHPIPGSSSLALATPQRQMPFPTPPHPTPPRPSPPPRRRRAAGAARPQGHPPPRRPQVRRRRPLLGLGLRLGGRRRGARPARRAAAGRAEPGAGVPAGAVQRADAAAVPAAQRGADRPQGLRVAVVRGGAWPW